MTRTGQQIERMASLLRDVQRSGGRDNWPHLHSHGHRYSTVMSAVTRGYLKVMNGTAYEYELTDDAAAFGVWYDLWKKTA